MKPKEWQQHIGEKVDIVRGELVLSPDGFLTVATNPELYTLYVDQTSGICAPVVPKSDLRGRLYKLGFSDCLTLYVDWSDANKGTDLRAKLRRITRRVYVDRASLSIDDLLIENGFVRIDPLTAEWGDMLIFELVNHVGVYLGDGKVLHQLPRMYSSIDTVDLSIVTEAYRYGN